ncbi:unnamed protein product [Rotaria sp. Silwood1]|nr:unnamed protein product [Rotaria sp. Silwood1]
MSNSNSKIDRISRIYFIKQLKHRTAPLKPSKSILIFKVFFSTLQLFIERSPYFHDLSIHTRQILIQNNFETAGALNSIFLIRELKALDNMVFITNCTTIYGDKIGKGYNTGREQVRSQIYL